MFEAISFAKRFVPSSRFDAPSTEIIVGAITVAIDYAHLAPAQVRLYWGEGPEDTLILVDHAIVGVIERQKSLINDALGWHISQLEHAVAEGCWRGLEADLCTLAPDEQAYVESCRGILARYGLTAEQYHQALCQALELLREEEARPHDHA